MQNKNNYMADYQRTKKAFEEDAQLTVDLVLGTSSKDVFLRKRTKRINAILNALTLKKNK